MIFYFEKSSNHNDTVVNGSLEIKLEMWHFAVSPLSGMVVGSGKDLKIKRDKMQ